MGIDYSATFGYGVALTDGEAGSCVSTLVEEGFLPQDTREDDPHEILCDHYDLTFETAGNSFTGDTYVVIGPDISMNDAEATVTVDQKGLLRLKRMLTECDLTEKIAWYLGGHVW